MTTRQSTASGPILTYQVDATFQQVRAMGILVTNLAQVLTSLLRIPLLVAQIITLLLAVPFLLAQTITSTFAKAVEGVEQQSWNRPPTLQRDIDGVAEARPKPSTGSWGIPRPHVGKAPDSMGAMPAEA